MTVRYVGPGGSDSNDGLTWANRKLTLNGVEDTPVVAGDTVYVGPGVYRETLTVDVNGSSGNPITYIGDVTGYHTDGVGGIVRISGSDDDIGFDRSRGIDLASRTYRTFRGLCLDSFSQNTDDGAIYGAAPDNIIIEDCVIFNCGENGIAFSILQNATYHYELRRLYITHFSQSGIRLYDFAGGAALDGTSTIENCIISEGAWRGIYNFGVAGAVARNCTIDNCFYGANGSGLTIYNSIITNCNTGLLSITASDYNNVTQGNNTPYSGVSAGTNDVQYMPGFKPKMLADGLLLMSPNPSWYELAEWSSMRYRAGNSPPTDDFYGKPRPTANAKKSWGAIQYRPAIRSTESPYSDEPTATRLPDAGLRQLFLPVSGGEEVTVSVWVYRAGDYTGTLPQMVIREEDQSPRTTTDTGPAGQYNLLSDTFTPQANTRYVVIDLISDNTASSGDYYVDFSGFSSLIAL